MIMSHPNISGAMIHRLPSIRWQLEKPSMDDDRRAWPGPAIGHRSENETELRIVESLKANLKAPIESGTPPEMHRAETLSSGDRSAGAIEIHGVGVLILTGNVKEDELLEIGRKGVDHILPAAHAAINGELLQNIQNRFRNYRSVERRIAESLAQVTDLKNLGTTVNMLAESLLTTEYTAVYFMDPSSNELKLTCAKGLEDWEVEDAERTAWDRHPGHVLRTGEVVHVHDTENDPQQRTRTSSRRATIRSRCYLPVIVADQVIGTLGLASSKLGAFDEYHLEGVKFLTDLAGLTWSRIREEYAKQRRDRLLQASGACADLLVRTRHWQTCLDAVLEIVRGAFEVEHVHIVSIEPDEFQGTTSDRGNPQLSDQMSEELLNHKVSFEKATEECDSLLAAPILVANSPWGALVIEDQNIDLKHDDVVISAMRAVSNSIGSAITREELQLELVQAHKMEAIGLLAGGIAHDFNNLLWPILTYSELLQKVTADQKSLTMLSDINLAATRAASLVEEILFISRRRIESDESIAISEVLKEVLDIIRPTLPETVNLNVSISPDAGNVIGDRTAVHRMLMNLCSNARTAMKGCTGNLSILARTAEPFEQIENGVDTLIIEIMDQGAGMTEKVRKNLFEPYFTTQTAGNGTGLGLTIVQRVATELGGLIEVESSHNQGSTFRVSLPRATPTAVQSDEHSECIPSMGESILLIDDDPNVLGASKSLLESIGYSVHAIQNSEEALLHLQNANMKDPKFDLIITDLTMPVVDGIQLAREAHLLHPKVPVVLFTGFGEFDKDEELNGIISAFIQKPISRKKLAEILREVLTQSKRMVG
jgi:signal transduction histidine kinase/DNA-binding NarL/FixJ family response regulator